MRRREFITLFGGAVAAPMLSTLAARAQQVEKIPKIGYLSDEFERRLIDSIRVIRFWMHCAVSVSLMAETSSSSIVTLREGSNGFPRSRPNCRQFL